MSKPRLLYIGLTSHRKTRSTVFLQELLKTKYDVFCLDVDAPMEEISEARIESLGSRQFDVLAVFQVWLDLDALKRSISFRHGVWFPMFDGMPADNHPFFSQITGFNIISFSFFVHEKLLRLGYASHYVQYFPCPAEKPDFGEPDTVYLWQRWSQINLSTVETLFRGRRIAKIHLHKVLDPGYEFTGIPASLADRVEVSTWYDTRAGMQADQRKYAYYLAPRLYEGIGMGFLEAMATGKCVIAANYPTANEYIEHGVNGLLFDERHLQPIQHELALGEMQRNAYDSCRIGYQRWLKRRWAILDWCDCPIPVRPCAGVEGLSDISKFKTRDAARLVIWRVARRTFMLFPHPIRLFVNRLVGRAR